MSKHVVTDTIKKFKLKDAFHWIGGEYKPYWITGEHGELKNPEDITGWNSGDPSSILAVKIEDMIEDGEIKYNVNYMIEIDVKITELKLIGDE